MNQSFSSTTYLKRSAGHILALLLLAIGTLTLAACTQSASGRRADQSVLCDGSVSCELPGECMRGVIACNDDGTTLCSAAGPFPAGTTTSNGKVCDGFGNTADTLTVGSPCIQFEEPCKKGVIQPSADSRFQCQASTEILPFGSACPEGYCDGSGLCITEESGSRVDDNGTPIAVSCQLPGSSCAAGQVFCRDEEEQTNCYCNVVDTSGCDLTCMVTDTIGTLDGQTTLARPAAVGTVCDGGFCDGFGKCVACANAGQPCRSNDGCSAGTIVCEGEVSRCEPDAAAGAEPTGRLCGEEAAGYCDGNNMCVACKNAGSACRVTQDASCSAGIIVCMDDQEQGVCMPVAEGNSTCGVITPPDNTPGPGGPGGTPGDGQPVCEAGSDANNDGIPDVKQIPGCLPPSANPFNCGGHDYVYAFQDRGPGEFTWEAALEVCNKLPGYRMVWIESAVENECIKQNTVAKVDKDVWIGLRNQNGVWRWQPNGPSLAETGFTDWEDSGKDCANIDDRNYWGWDVQDCNHDTQEWVVCEQIAP